MEPAINSKYVAESLSRTYYGYQECIDAMRGKRLPPNLGNFFPRICTIRGIRYHAGFAAVAKVLYGLSDHPEFTRALNARSIMSNVVSEMKRPHEFPYFIWYPDVASETTYHTLAKINPQMRYHVGRACAVAGYIDLYRELDLLPEVSIAEKARDNLSNGKLIFDVIMAHHDKFAIMNDYTRSVDMDHSCAGAGLNADTESVQHFDGARVEPWGKEDVSLLYSPLAFDLPNHRKDVLILVADFNGDIDRYAQLRRPQMIDNEEACRGCISELCYPKAISARFIMNNDLSRITDATYERDLPYLIHYPARASSYTYEQLAHRKPSMKPQIARAAIVKDDQTLYDGLDITPDYFIVCEARASPNPYYLADLLSRAERLNIDVLSNPQDLDWRAYTRSHDMELTSTFLCKTISMHSITGDEYDGHIHEGMRADISQIELFICSHDNLRPKVEESIDLRNPYHEASNPDEGRLKLLKD